MNDPNEDNLISMISFARKLSERQRKSTAISHLNSESNNMDPLYPLSDINLGVSKHGLMHIPFKTAKWQEWVRKSQISCIKVEFGFFIIDFLFVEVG